MTTVQVTLPESLAREAARAGLSSLSKLEILLREELKAQRVDALFAAMERMAEVQQPAIMSPEEVADEIATMRAERRCWWRLEAAQ